MTNLHKIVLITGSSSGIGRLTALALARAGHSVYASVRSTKESAAAVAEFHQIANAEQLDLRPLEMDVRSEASCRAAVDRVLAERGRIDVVMNNAAMMMLGVTEAFRPEQIAEIIDVNAISWVRVNRAVLPAMRRQRKGLLVYTGSVISLMADPFTGPYAASKAAGDLLAQIMAFENSRYGIESVIVMPGVYTTGTDHLKHSVAPLDGAVAEQYAMLTGLPEALPKVLDGANGPGVRTDPGEVAETIRDVVAMEHGTRPRRVIVDPQRRKLEEVVELSDGHHRNFFERLGIDDLLRVAPDPSREP